MKGTGTQVLADLHDCMCDEGLLRTSSEGISSAIRSIIEKGNFHVISYCAHQFQSDGKDDGYSLVYLLKESHCAIHTWPEQKKVNLCLYTCNYTTDNSVMTLHVAEEIIKYYGAENPIIRVIGRS